MMLPRARCVALCLFMASVAVHAATPFPGPSPYRSAADSPFQSVAGLLLSIDTFETGSRLPGVTYPTAPGPTQPTILGSDTRTDSVDADDGLSDGLGRNGRSFFSNGATNILRFSFAVPVTHAGLVLTDVGQRPPGQPTGVSPVLFEAFGPGGALLGSISLASFGDGAVDGATAEDRFFGVIHAGGVSAIQISLDSTDFEVDHCRSAWSRSPASSR